MNRRMIDELIPRAYEVLAEVATEVKTEDQAKKTVKIVNEGTIKKAWRGQIASFGAAISTGSLLAAISFYSEQHGASVPRQLLIKAIGKLIGHEDLFQYVKGAGAGARAPADTDVSRLAAERKVKEEIINAAIALKLAMNLYKLEEGRVQCKI